MGGRHATRPQKKSRDLPFADRDNGERYARVKAMLGSGRARVEDSDGLERVCKVKGSLYKREYVRTNDLVLISSRQCETTCTKCDILFKYTEDEARLLRKYGELTDWRSIETEDAAGQEDAELVAFESDDMDYLTI